jgi:hypothetical protein
MDTDQHRYLVNRFYLCLSVFICGFLFTKQKRLSSSRQSKGGTSRINALASRIIVVNSQNGVHY